MYFVILCVIFSPPLIPQQDFLPYIFSRAKTLSSSRWSYLDAGVMCGTLASLPSPECILLSLKSVYRLKFFNGDFDLWLAHNYFLCVCCIAWMLMFECICIFFSLRIFFLFIYTFFSIICLYFFHSSLSLTILKPIHMFTSYSLVFRVFPPFVRAVTATPSVSFPLFLHSRS